MSYLLIAYSPSGDQSSWGHIVNSWSEEFYECNRLTEQGLCADLADFYYNELVDSDRAYAFYIYEDGICVYREDALAWEPLTDLDEDEFKKHSAHTRLSAIITEAKQIAANKYIAELARKAAAEEARKKQDREDEIRRTEARLAELKKG